MVFFCLSITSGPSPHSHSSTICSLLTPLPLHLHLPPPAPHTNHPKVWQASSTTASCKPMLSVWISRHDGTPRRRTHVLSVSPCPCHGALLYTSSESNFSSQPYHISLPLTQARHAAVCLHAGLTSRHSRTSRRRTHVTSASRPCPCHGASPHRAKTAVCSPGRLMPQTVAGNKPHL